MSTFVDIFKLEYKMRKCLAIEIFKIKDLVFKTWKLVRINPHNKNRCWFSVLWVFLSSVFVRLWQKDGW